MPLRKRITTPLGWGALFGAAAGGGAGNAYFKATRQLALMQPFDAAISTAMYVTIGAAVGIALGVSIGAALAAWKRR